jgi:hypothetical protein
MVVRSEHGGVLPNLVSQSMGVDGRMDAAGFR